MDFSPLIAYVNKLHQEMKVPGCDIKIMRHHETLLRYSIGTRDYAHTEPVRPDDIYMMFSCTKPVTCTAAMQLVEKGIIGLDDPVSKYLPEFKNAFLMKDGKPVPTQKTMTIRNLFTMSSGLDYNYEAQPVRDVIAKNPNAGTVDIVNAFIRSPLQFEPGERFEYSLSHDVLAAVVEVVSGKSYLEYLRENIFEPLGMKDTTFHITPEQRQRQAAVYASTGKDNCEPSSMKCNYKLADRYESGGAGLYSTVDDYSLFADAMANGGIGTNGKQILKAESIDLLRTEQLSKHTIDPTFSCYSGPGYGYAFGVRTLIDKSEGQRSSIGEFGWDGAAGSYVMIDPAYGLSIFFAMHVKSWPNLIGRAHIPLRDLTYEALGL